MGQVIAIAAVADNGVIGNCGKLPWNIPQDLKRFKKVTTGSIVLMGRKTFESLGSKPLPNRLNLVVSSSCGNASKNLLFVNDLLLAIHQFSSRDDRDLYIIGGGRIYQDSINVVDRLDLTRVSGEFEGDTYFPEVDYSQFTLVNSNRLTSTPHCWTEMYVRVK